MCSSAQSSPRRSACGRCLQQSCTSWDGDFPLFINGYAVYYSYRVRFTHTEVTMPRSISHVRIIVSRRKRLRRAGRIPGHRAVPQPQPARRWPPLLQPHPHQPPLARHYSRSRISRDPCLFLIDLLRRPRAREVLPAPCLRYQHFPPPLLRRPTRLSLPPSAHVYTHIWLLRPPISLPHYLR